MKKKRKQSAHSQDISVIQNSWKMLKYIVNDGPDMHTKQELENKINKSIDIFNMAKSITVKKMQNNFVDRYLEVLIKHGAKL